ncbi:MAG TPA: hypothetical protein VMD27_00745 [Candidatus Aquilonibacter sp.]|nr:hypothetical protein [Candidatus Aquilonibacter sp.]
MSSRWLRPALASRALVFIFILNKGEKVNPQKQKCWGDYIKSCTIQKTSTNTFNQYQNWFYFEISENGTNIFESGEITNNEPVTYERKSGAF